MNRNKNNSISESTYKKYFIITKQALQIAQRSEHKKEAEIIFDMCNRYLEDSKYFASKGDFVRAFGAVNYAHGWLDCGASLKIFIVKNSRFFTVDD